jgi:hydroxypyruvate isomerase
VVARALAEVGFTGTVGLEAFASADTLEALKRFREAFTL